VARAVKPAVSRFVSTFLDARETQPKFENVATNGDAAGKTARATLRSRLALRTPG
jgi:hypothetical protein